MKTVLFASLSSLLLFITSCCSAHTAIKHTYQQAVTKAALHQLKPSPLLAIPPSKPYLTMVTWTSKTYQPGRHHLHHPVWVTVTKQLKQTCRHFPKDQTASSIEQLLGMPPRANYSSWHLTIMLVPNHQAHIINTDQPFSPGIFRPCFSSNSIRTSTCSYQITSTKPAYDRWLLHLSLQQYRTQHGYPWTGLGYTYNWNPQAQSKIGLSEFIITQKTPVTIINSKSPAVFCYNS